MKLRIEIDLANDAFQGKARAVREVRRMIAAYLSRCAINGELTEKPLMDVNGNKVGNVELVKWSDHV
jgi:hypothetical protein